MKGEIVTKIELLQQRLGAVNVELSKILAEQEKPKAEAEPVKE